MTFRARLGAVTETGCKAIIASDVDATVSASISGGGVATVTQLTNRLQTIAAFLGAGLVEFSALKPFTVYTYTLTQGATTITGSFRTLPDNQATDFSFIASTCDNHISRGGADICGRVLQEMQTLNAAGFPTLFMVHPDDVHYVDSIQVNVSPYVSTGEPQDTGDPDDYAIGWAAYLGVFRTPGKYSVPSRQSMYGTLPFFGSGGDHMIEGNHCRGAIGNADYRGCNRGPTASIPNLDTIAIAEWMAFVGNANPDPLRADELYWGFDAGPVRFGLLDIQKHCQPYSSTGNDTIAGGYQDGVRYGAQQITDMTTWMDVDTHPFKCLLHESGFSEQGQPWLEWHTTEAQAWKDDWDARDNLNGVDGNIWHICGDMHHANVTSFDTFWSFFPGVFQDSSVCCDQSTQSYQWGGKYRGGLGRAVNTGDQGLAGFFVFKVHAALKIIEAYYVEIASRYRVGPVFFEHPATDNQWTYTPSGITYPRTRVA